MKRTYQCKACDHSWDLNLSAAECDTPKSDPCPGCNEHTEIVVKIFDCPGFGTSIRMMGSGAKLGEDFKSRMKQISDENPGNNMRLR